LFADIIKKVPVRNYGIESLETHVDHTSTGTVYFVSAEKEVVFPEHSHAAQWTIVVNGSCTFTANGESKVYSAGETYFIPAGLKHQITLHAVCGTRFKQTCQTVRRSRGGRARLRLEMH